MDSDFGAEVFLSVWTVRGSAPPQLCLLTWHSSHCATHQIRVILISCIVITSLFYPALSIYSSSQQNTHAFLDSFLSPETVSGFHAQKDLVNLWSGYDTLRVHDDPVSRAKCQVGRAVRVERVLIQGPLTDDEGAINQHTLLSALDLQLRLETLITAGDSPCLKQPDGKCFVLSPLAFWNYDRDALRSDSNTPNALSHRQNVTVAGVTVTPAMVLAGRGSYEHHVSSSKFDYATFLALTYFFPESGCFGNTEHAQWVQTVQYALSQHTEITVQIQEPTIVALEVRPNFRPCAVFSFNVPHSTIQICHLARAGRLSRLSFILHTSASSPTLLGPSTRWMPYTLVWVSHSQPWWKSQSVLLRHSVCVHSWASESQWFLGM